MEQYFTVTASTPIYLYGAASIGKIVYERNSFLNLCGFIDKRAEEIVEFMGLPVYTLSQASRFIDKDSVIMIAVKNVFELEDIAVSLYEAGFEKIIYKSKAILDGQGQLEDDKLSETWDKMVRGDYEITCEKLLCFQNKISVSFSDKAVIQQTNGEILAYIPIELIYTNDRRDKWADLNIQGYYPHIYFFYFLSNHKNGQVQDYLEFVEGTAIDQGDIKITEAWKKNVLRNRTAIYENMRFNLDMNPDFFNKNAPTAVWNEKGYFNLTSGKHRCAFLVAQGYRYIALRMKEEAYNKFFNYGDVRRYCDKIEVEKSRYIATRVYHPWLYQYPCSEPMYYSYFQIEALCRSIRLACKLGRAVTIYTNMPFGNSLVRILQNSRLINTTNTFYNEEVDIALYDTTINLVEDKIEELSACLKWYIGLTPIGDVVAEYFSEAGTVFFCECSTREEEE